MNELLMTSESIYENVETAHEELSQVTMLQCFNHLRPLQKL